MSAGRIATCGVHHGRTPQLLISRRVAVIARLGSIGYGHAAICRYVAKQQEREATERAAAAGEAADAPGLWGIEPVSGRTISRYIARARARVKSEILGVIANSGELFANHIEQLDALYAAAFRKGRFSACVRVLELKDRIFGFNEIARAVAPIPGSVEDAGDLPIVEIRFDGPELPPESRARLMARYAMARTDPDERCVDGSQTPNAFH